MLTALHIEEHTDGSFFRRFRRDRVRAEHRYCDSAVVRSVTYEHYRGKVNWESIDRFVRGERARVLCAPQLTLPAERGYRRFTTSALSRRMCGNAALFLLRSIARRDVKVALIDRTGECVDLCEKLCEYADPVYVVTDEARLYAALAENLLSEKGAVLRAVKGAGVVRGADLVISPAAIDSVLCCQPTAVVLSGEEPSAPHAAPVICDYVFELPKKYADVKPPYLSGMYFASALYSACDAHELGAELFTRCSDGTVIHTRQSLVEMLKKRLDRI